MVKFLKKKDKAVNLANIDEIQVANNYLTITTGAGLNARTMLFYYGATADIEALYEAVMDFLASDKQVFDCEQFMSNR